MCDDPKIYTGCAMCGGKENLEGSPSNYKVELKGDLIIIHLWTQGTDSIHDICVMNNDATSNQSN